MIELTQEQQRQLARQHEFPPRVKDPSTQEEFVLLSAEMYERVRAHLEEEDEIDSVREMYPLVQDALDAGRVSESPGTSG